MINKKHLIILFINKTLIHFCLEFIARFQDHNIWFVYTMYIRLYIITARSVEHPFLFKLPGFAYLKIWKGFVNLNNNRNILLYSYLSNETKYVHYLNQSIYFSCMQKSKLKLFKNTIWKEQPYYYSTLLQHSQ